MISNLQRLVAFQRVYKLGSVRAAAQSLGVTQSALSQQLSKLEAELEVQLFIRRHRRLVAAPASHSLARKVETFLGELDQELELIRTGRTSPQGNLRVGAPREFGARSLPDWVAAFRRRYPAVSFSVTLGGPELTLPMVEEGELDLAFCDVFEPHRSEFASLAFRKLLDEELILVGSGAYLRRVLDGDVSVARLLRADFVDYTPRAQAVRHWFRFHYRRSPGQLNIAFSLQSVPGVVSAVLAGLGLGVVPAPSVARELRAGRLVEVLTPRKRIKNVISLAQLQDKKASAAERLFVASVRS